MRSPASSFEPCGPEHSGTISAAPLERNASGPATAGYSACGEDAPPPPSMAENCHDPACSAGQLLDRRLLEIHYCHDAGFVQTPVFVLRYLSFRLFVSGGRCRGPEHRVLFTGETTSGRDHAGRVRRRQRRRRARGDPAAELNVETHLCRPWRRAPWLGRLGVAAAAGAGKEETWRRVVGGEIGPPGCPSRPAGGVRGPIRAAVSGRSELCGLLGRGQAVGFAEDVRDRLQVEQGAQ